MSTLPLDQLLQALGAAAVSDEDVPAAVAVLAEGGAVVLVDEEADSGDLVMAASTATAAGINLLAKRGRGLTSLALSAARVQGLGLPPMAASWGPPRKPFTVSIEARDGIATGISAADRARTIGVAVDLQPQLGLQGKVALRPVLAALAAAHVTTGLFLLDKQLTQHPDGLQVEAELSTRLQLVLDEFAAAVLRLRSGVALLPAQLRDSGGAVAREAARA